jgi:hypothetical protein
MVDPVLVPKVDLDQVDLDLVLVLVLVVVEKACPLVHQDHHQVDPEMVQVVLLVLYYLASLDLASLEVVPMGFLDHPLQDPDRLDNLVVE